MDPVEKVSLQGASKSFILRCRLAAQEQLMSFVIAFIIVVLLPRGRAIRLLEKVHLVAVI